MRNSRGKLEILRKSGISYENDGNVKEKAGNLKGKWKIIS